MGGKRRYTLARSIYYLLKIASVKSSVAREMGNIWLKIEKYKRKVARPVGSHQNKSLDGVEVRRVDG